MALRLTSRALGSSAGGYSNRVMVCAHRRRRAFYRQPKLAHARSPLAHKAPEDYGDTWDPRSGVEWHNRLRRRGPFRHWPWARWTDDPVRQHREPAHTQTLSARASGASDGVPLWNYYEEVGQEYGTPSHFPIHYMAPFIHQYTGKVWSREEIERHLKDIEEKTGLHTIQGVHESFQVVLDWSEREKNEVPYGLIQHVKMLANDIVLQNNKTVFRKKLHKNGILRTTSMERYYALPHLRSSSPMPQELEQPSGKYPWGKYTQMLGDQKIHPLYKLDRFYKDNMYPD